ncbi:MAG: PAS domain S-box protein [Burkholderiaceae bacterium]|nr:PAS domain S-box protein [Burkholderiaceae bacterium]
MDPVTAPPIDFALLELDTRPSSALHRRAIVWLVGMLLLVAVSTVVLALFLRSVETEEEARQRSADAQWLDQTLRFHLRRLEGDLAVLALQTQRTDGAVAPALHAGQLWRSPAVVLHHGWVAAGSPHWQPFLQVGGASRGETGGTETFATMLETTRGLQRAAYGRPLPDAQGAADKILWLAVPLFEQGRFLGDYVATIDLEPALAAVIPPWFLQEHAVALADDATSVNRVQPSEHAVVYLAPVHLPGAPLELAVRSLSNPTALAPRLFFSVTLVCLVGMLVAMYFLWRDTALRQRAESRLQTQIALRTAMERSVTLGLRAWDLQGRLIYVNQAFCHLLGWSAQELLTEGAGAASYWPADQGDEFTLLRQHTAQPLEQQVGLEMQLRHRQGHLLEVLVHSAPLTLMDATVIGWMDSVLDMTERHRLDRMAARRQEILESSGRLIAVGAVASTLAHELNQPLGALSSFANGLLNRLREGRITLDETTPVVERMERLAQKAGRVIQRVNAFARRQEMTRQPLQLMAFITRVVGHVPLPQGLALELHLPATECTLPADGLLLEHALHNIVLNATEWATQAARPAARVRVSVRESDSMIGICTEDSGPGVPPEQQQSIFDAFASQKSGGMGMGLSICRSIIEAHHGRIEVEHSAALHGAKFTLWLPRNCPNP